MSVPFVLARGVTGFCILSGSKGTKQYVTIGGSVERQEAKPASPFGKQSGQQMANEKGKGAT